MKIKKVKGWAVIGKKNGELYFVSMFHKYVLRNMKTFGMEKFEKIVECTISFVLPTKSKK